MNARQLIEAEDPKEILRQHTVSQRITLDSVRDRLVPLMFELLQGVNGPYLRKIRTLRGGGQKAMGKITVFDDGVALVAVHFKKPDSEWQLHKLKRLNTMDALLAYLKNYHFIE